MSEKINFTINGTPSSVEADPELTLLDVIRDVLNLTGTKRGCDSSTCGTCVVVVNGRAVAATIQSPKRKGQCSDRRRAEPGHGAAPGTKALAESGAVQCGFCTPGIVMELYALLQEKSPTPRNAS